MGSEMCIRDSSLFRVLGPNLEALGATPQARAKLGVNTGRALDLARLMAEAEAKREGGETDERDTDQVEG